MGTIEGTSTHDVATQMTNLAQFDGMDKAEFAKQIDFDLNGWSTKEEFLADENLEEDWMDSLSMSYQELIEVYYESNDDLNFYRSSPGEFIWLGYVKARIEDLWGTRNEGAGRRWLYQR